MTTKNEKFTEATLATTPATVPAPATTPATAPAPAPATTPAATFSGKSGQKKTMAEEAVEYSQKPLPGTKTLKRLWNGFCRAGALGRLLYIVAGGFLITFSYYWGKAALEALLPVLGNECLPSMLSAVQSPVFWGFGVLGVGAFAATAWYANADRAYRKGFAAGAASNSKRTGKKQRGKKQESGKAEQPK